MGATRAYTDEIRKDLSAMKQRNPGMRPNFSALAREYNVSRHTIAKIWGNPDQPPKPRKPKKSMLDPYREEIREKFKEGPYSVKTVFQHFQSKYQDPAFSSYETFKTYVKRHRLKTPKTTVDKSDTRSKLDS